MSEELCARTRSSFGRRGAGRVGTIMLLLLVLAFPVYMAVESSRRTDALRVAGRRPDRVRGAALGPELRGVSWH